MPEGPSMVILKETVAEFEGKKILEATGNSKIDKSLLVNRKATFKTWENISLFACQKILFEFIF